MINLLLECKEALFNVNAVKCYDSGDFPCECTMCKINNFIDAHKTIEIKIDKNLGFVDIYNYRGLCFSREPNDIQSIFKCLLSIMDGLNKDFGLNEFYLKSDFYRIKDIHNMFINNNYTITL